MAQPIEIWTDGSSLRNPGAAGLGYIIRYYKEAKDGEMPEACEIEGKQGFRLSTNNRMELMAVLYGVDVILEKMDAGIIPDAKQINLFSDSEYFVKAITQNWISRWMANNWMTSSFGGKKPALVKNKDLWEKIFKLQETLRSRGIVLVVTHVAGHSGQEYNERADKLAVAASSSGDDKKRDEEYERISPYVISEEKGA